MAPDPYSRGLAGQFVSLFFLAVSSIAVKEMRLGVAQEAIFPHMERIVTTSKLDNGTPLRTEYSGNKYLDTGLQYLVAAFMPGVGGLDTSFQIQQIYFLVSFFPVLAIWSVEAGRRRNVKALTSLYDLPTQFDVHADICQHVYLGNTLPDSRRWYSNPTLLFRIFVGITLRILLGTIQPHRTNLVRQNASPRPNCRVPSPNDRHVFPLVRPKFHPRHRRALAILPSPR
jgi:hypothetical protein